MTHLDPELVDPPAIGVVPWADDVRETKDDEREAAVLTLSQQFLLHP